MKFKTKKNKSIFVRLLLIFISGLIIFLFPVSTVQAKCHGEGEHASFWSGKGQEDFWGDFENCTRAVRNWAKKNQPKGVTSFVEFEGGLQPPSGEGLAGEITRVKTAREFILNVTNFALSFLGLIAVIVIIYGGFLYVTARGEEEQTGKGKKAIQYAIIGIVIILFSFALVNTLITQAPTGGEDRGAAPLGGQGGIAATNIEQGRLFNLAALEVQAAFGNFVILYQNYIATDNVLESIRDFPAPRSGVEARTFLMTFERGMNGIRHFSSPLHEAYAAANNVLDDFIRPWQNRSNEELDAAVGVRQVQQTRQSFIRPAFAQTGGGDSLYQSGRGEFAEAFKKAMNDHFKLNAARNIQPHVKDFQKEVEKIIDRISLVQRGLGPLGDAPAGEYLQRNITSEEELRRTLAGVPPDFTVKQAFEEASSALATAKETLTTNPDDTAVVGDTSEKMQRLFLVVKEIKFIAVKINASLIEGNAPLGVKFTSLGSLDPSGETITDEQHEWDLDGNGQGAEEVNSIGCKEKGGAGIACVYDEPGTYRVSLRLNPKGGVTQTAAGIATIAIKINPPSSRIHLVAQNGDTTEVLNEFDAEGKLKISKNTYTLTVDEAKVGVKLDASKTTDGGGLPANITNYQWNFGDGSDPIFGPNASVIDNPKKTYGRTGVFALTLEVMDKGGKKDRKFVNVVVTSIAARILAPTLRGDLNTTFVFDGSRSKSDVGSIDSFEWKIFDQEGKETAGLQNNTSDTFRYTFQNPGKYTVRLKVTDKAGNEGQAEVAVAVESQKPTADFEIRGCVAPELPCLDTTQPSLVEFDASKSFDPDSADTLSYRWEILNATAINDYEVKEGKLGDATSEGATAVGTKTVKIKFKKTGHFMAKLTVQDQHKDRDLRKEHSKEQEFDIASIVDLLWDPQMIVAQKLDEKGVAVIVFKANVANGEQYVIDFGDNTPKQEDQISGNQIVISHAYNEPKTYAVTLTAKSETSGSTTVKKRVYVGSGDSPLAVIDIKKEGGQTVFLEGDDPLVVLRKQETLTFDASGSINTQGKSEGLEYSWNFGDGITSSNAIAQHTYENVSPADPGYYEVTLTVIEEDLNTREVKSSEMKVKVAVEGAKPTLTALSVVKRSEGDTTPLNFEVKTEGALDADGEIKEYTFWYFDEADPERKLSVTTTNQNRALLKIETKGLAAEEKRYSFCAEMKDNENNVSTCEELFPDKKQLPFALVKNGPNQAPSVDITADRTNIRVGESITLSAQATDADGRVAKYVWDVLGDGFHNDAETELSQITQKYDNKSPRGGYRVRAKGIDDQGAEGFSNEILIHVDLPSDPPLARFTFTPAAGTVIRFNNNSIAAPGSDTTLESFQWDFDTQQEFCTANERSENVCPSCRGDNPLCDHVNDNDPDSMARNPEFEYPSSGRYEVRLTVEDNNGQQAEAVNTITVERGAAPQQAPIKAILRAETINGKPARKGADGRYHLRGNGATVGFYVGDSRGQIFEYSIDQNIYFDSDGDGSRENDRNFVTPDGSRRFSARYLRNFQPQPPGGLFIAQLTIKGRDDQNRILTDVTALSDDAEGKPAIFVFDRPTGAAALFDQLGAREAILLGLVGGAILAVIGYFITLIGRRGKPREIG